MKGLRVQETRIATSPPRIRRRWPAVVGAMVVGAGLLGGGGTAQAARSGAETEYQCAAKPDGLAEEASLKLRLAVPSSVSPGEEVRLKGRAMMTFGRRQSAITRLSMADTATLTSSNLYVLMKAGSAERELGIQKIKSKPASTADTYTPAARVSLPSFIVPEGVRRVSLRLPSRAATGNPAGNEPSNVIFTVTVTPNGGIGGPRQFGCWLDEGQQAATIARIGVKQGLRSKSRSKSDGIVVPDRPLQNSVTGRAPDSSPSNNESDSSDNEPAPESANSVPLAAEAPSSRKTFAAIPPNTKLGGLVVPTWALMFFAAVTPLAATGFVAAARHRLKLLAGGKGL